MSRNGKIARLPRWIREQLNRHLQNGKPGEALLVALNEEPEVQAVLQAEFAGVPINKQNLYEWRKGGYVEWEFKGNQLQDSSETKADAEEIAAATDGRLADHLATILTARYASLVRSWNGEATDEFRAKLKVLRGQVQDVSLLRRWDHSAAKVAMQQEMHEAQREKTDEEVIEAFEGWIKRPAVQDWIRKNWKSPVEREQEKRRLLGRRPLTEEEIARMESLEGGKFKDQNSKSKEAPSSMPQENGDGHAGENRGEETGADLAVEAEESKPVKPSKAKVRRQKSGDRSQEAGGRRQEAEFCTASSMGWCPGCGILGLGKAGSRTGTVNVWCAWVRPASD